MTSTAAPIETPRPGNRLLRQLPLLALLYGTGRFLLDFLRASDVAYADARYYGLTPAQYVCIALVVYGAAGLLRGRRESRLVKPA